MSRVRTPVGTFGAIGCEKLPNGQVTARARYRDHDGRLRILQATAGSRTAAEQALKSKIRDRPGFGTGSGSVTGDSPFTTLATLWLEDVELRVDLSEGTKEVYARELKSLVMPGFENMLVREVTAGRVDRFLKVQAKRSYARARHSKVLLKLIFEFAVREEAVTHNPTLATSPLKKPKKKPKALTGAQVAEVRAAAASWRAGKDRRGPRPNRAVADLIEVMLGSATRIGEALAVRRCDVDDRGEVMLVTVAGTVVARKGHGAVRQEHPKTDASRRTIPVAGFAAVVIRRRLAKIGDDPGALLFSTRYGTPISPHNARRTLRDMIHGIDFDGIAVTPHAFRRTGATAIARANGAQAAADYLGHSSSAVTIEFYIEPDESVDPTAAAPLDGLAPMRAIEAPRKNDAGPSEPGDRFDAA